MLGLHPSDHRIGNRTVGNVLDLDGQTKQIESIIENVFSYRFFRFCISDTLYFRMTFQLLTLSSVTDSWQTVNIKYSDRA